MIDTLKFYLDIIEKNLNPENWDKKDGLIMYTVDLILNEEEAEILFDKTNLITKFFGWREVIRERENIKHLGFIKDIRYSLSEGKLLFSIYEEDYILLKQIIIST